MRCPICDENDLMKIYEVKSIPIFQNKVYASARQAKAVTTSAVSLMHCQNCDFVHNADFDPALITYDENYQNEQANSHFFQSYLVSIIKLLESNNLRNKRVIEIGCGKGYFLNKLWERGFKATGFDPAYEGTHPNIIKDYFSDKYSNLQANLIILRHTLEHINSPLKFLKDIDIATSNNAMIFIEVPCFDWIVKHKAFWDIFYEHCNYFTSECLRNLFKKSKHGLFFNDQYQYILASLDDFQFTAQKAARIYKNSTESFMNNISNCRNFVNSHPGLIVWGAGAKGVTFVNIMDPECKNISCVVDINPKKQNKYVAKTAHNIISPEELDKFNGGDILVMNENYVEEVKLTINKNKFRIHVLEK